MQTTATTTITADQIARAEANVRDAQSKLDEAKATLRSLRGAVAKTRTAPRACGCGCGAMTGGGTYVPGHDAKLRSRLLVRIREDAPAGDGALALAELQAAGPKLAHGTGTWEIGKNRAERERKEARAAQDKADRAKRDKEAADAKAAAIRMQEQSRKEQNAVADHIAITKDAAIAKAREVGKIVMPAK